MEKWPKITSTNQNFSQTVPPPPPPLEDTYNPLTGKDFLSTKASSAGRAEAGEKGEHAWLGTAKKN